MIRIDLPLDTDPAHNLFNQRLEASINTESAQSFEAQLQERRKIQKQLTEKRQNQEEQNLAAGKKLATLQPSERLFTSNEPSLVPSNASSHGGASVNRGADPEALHLLGKENLSSHHFPAHTTLASSGLDAQVESLVTSFQSVLKHANHLPSALSTQESSDDKASFNDSKSTDAPIAVSVSKESGFTSKSPLISVVIQAPLHTAEGQQEINEKMLWMAHQNIRAAEIQLNPPELGPLLARLKISDDKKVQVVFLSHHESVRSSLTESLPQLNQLFVSHGLVLDQAHVWDQGRQGQTDSFSHFVLGNNDNKNTSLESGKLLDIASGIQVSNHLVDYYV